MFQLSSFCCQEKDGTTAVDGRPGDAREGNVMAFGPSPKSSWA